MIIVNPYTVIESIPNPTDHSDVLKHLEKVGRVCYKSENNITDSSASKFITSIRDHKHWAVLEHYWFTVSVDYDYYIALGNLIKFSNNPYMNMLKITAYEIDDGIYKFLVSFNATILNNIIKARNIYDDIIYIYPLIKVISDLYPELIYLDGIIPNEHMDVSIELLDRKAIKLLPSNIRDIHDFITIKFVTDRAIANEIVRHRIASYAQESTRYCNYSKDKFTNQISVIQPSNLTDDNLNNWKQLCELSEKYYFQMLHNNASAQIARAALPLSLKTELYMTANLWEFKHFFNMRCSSAAHPDLRRLTIPLVKQLNESDEYQMVFNEIVNNLETEGE